MIEERRPCKHRYTATSINQRSYAHTRQPDSGASWHSIFTTSYIYNYIFMYICLLYIYIHYIFIIYIYMYMYIYIYISYIYIYISIYTFIHAYIILSFTILYHGFVTGFGMTTIKSFRNKLRNNFRQQVPE